MKNSVLIAALLYSFCWTSGSVSGSEILTVHQGEDVTLQSANMFQDGSVTFWLRVINQTNTSCITVVNGDRRIIDYCEGFDRKSFEMTVNFSNVSLIIKRVNISDTGIYICGRYKSGELKFTVQHLHVIEKPNNMKLIFPGAESGLLLIIISFLFIQMKKLQRAQHGDKDEHQLQILDSTDRNHPADSDTRRKRRREEKKSAIGVNVATTKRRDRN